MNTKEYRWIDKSKWDRGPWDDEPDKVQWQDVVTGLPCLAVRNELGFWCGYVAITEDHPCFELPYDDEKVDLSCHGGLTFSGHCSEHNPEHGICHVPAPGEPDNVWWFGFDCGHAFDFCPGVVATLKECKCYNPDLHEHDVYRTLKYVRRECAKLARQLGWRNPRAVSPVSLG